MWARGRKNPGVRRFTAQRNLVEVQMAVGEWELGGWGEDYTLQPILREETLEDKAESHGLPPKRKGGGIPLP